MTENELRDLQRTAKPFVYADRAYWGCKDDDPDPNGDEWRLPPEVFNLIEGKRTYSNVKRFTSELDAIEALVAAIDKLQEVEK